jgi:hypothetical protein
MHKTARGCFFGEERVRLKEGFPLKLGEKEKTVWESDTTILDSTLHSKPVLHIEVFSQTGKLQWTEIKEILKNGREIKTRFDGSCNLTKDESLSNDPDYLRLAEQHRKKIPPFLGHVANIQDLSTSTRDIFQHYAMKTEEQPKQEKPKVTPGSFESPAIIHKGNVITIPTEVAREIGLRGHRQILWTGSEGYPAFELTDKVRYASRITQNQLIIKHGIAKEFGLEKGMIIQFLANDDRSVTLKKANERLPDARVIQEHEVRRQGKKTHLTMHVVVPPEIQKLGFRDRQVEWIKKGEEIIIKPADNLYLSSVTETIVSEKWSRFQVNIPEGMPEAKNLEVGMRVGFRINEERRVVITPKQA